MSKTHLISAILTAAALILAIIATTTEAKNDVPWMSTNDVSWMPMTDGELEMDSEVNRRILATTRYISYGALQANSVPCSRRGASYYNCRPSAQANPYTRSCSAITRCRS